VSISGPLFVDTIRSVIGGSPLASSGMSVSLHEPEIGEREHEFLKDCLDSTFVSSVGQYITQLEDRIREITGARHAIAVSNGTVGIEVALVLAGVTDGDEVIIPTLSFIATANAVVHARGIPHFIDSETATLGMDPDALAERLASCERRGDDLVNPATGRRIGAICPMHTLGHPTRIEEICRIAAEYGIPVVEDAAESLGSFVGARHTGTFGLLGVFSFNGNKIVTTGGGGVIVTNDDELGRRAKHLTTTAKLPHKWEFEHDEVGWNYRMPNINAALGMAQLEKFPRMLEDKRVLADRYAAAFRDIPGLTFVAEPAGTSSNYWLCAIKLDDADLKLRDELISTAHDSGFLVRPMWNLLHQQRPYRDSPRASTTVAEELHASIICIPSTPRLVR
jgi:perosamine synthetase